MNSFQFVLLCSGLHIAFEDTKWMLHFQTIIDITGTVAFDHSEECVDLPDNIIICKKVNKLIKNLGIFN